MKTKFISPEEQRAGDERVANLRELIRQELRFAPACIGNGGQMMSIEYKRRVELALRLIAKARPKEGDLRDALNGLLTIDRYQPHVVSMDGKR